MINMYCPDNSFELCLCTKCAQYDDDMECCSKLSMAQALWLIAKHNRDLLRRLEKLERVAEAAQELQEVAELRGDNVLPLPEDDPMLWTARMQTAWNEIEAALDTLDGDGNG